MASYAVDVADLFLMSPSRIETMNETSKTIADITSLGIVGSTLASALPPLAAGLSVAWTLIRLYETETIRRWLKR
jgi:hypothetical protein